LKEQVGDLEERAQAAEERARKAEAHVQELLKALEERDMSVTLLSKLEKEKERDLYRANIKIMKLVDKIELLQKGSSPKEEKKADDSEDEEEEEEEEAKGEKGGEKEEAKGKEEKALPQDKSPSEPQKEPEVPSEERNSAPESSCINSFLEAFSLFLLAPLIIHKSLAKPLARAPSRRRGFLVESVNFLSLRSQV